jgi:hypothetical protein
MQTQALLFHLFQCFDIAALLSPYMYSDEGESGFDPRTAPQQMKRHHIEFFCTFKEGEILFPIQIMHINASVFTTSHAEKNLKRLGHETDWILGRWLAK